MPFYRYACTNCGHEFRHLHFDNSNNDDVICPKCDSTDLERQPPRVAVQFKGSGYYKTDRANKKSRAGTKGLSDKDTSAESTSSEANEPKESKASVSDSSSKTD